MPHTKRFQAPLILGAVSIAAGIFLLDIKEPLHVEVGTLYVIPILIGVWLPSMRYPLVAAGAATILIAAGHPLSPPSPTGLWIEALNRCISTLVVWAVGLGVARHQRDLRARSATQGALERSLKELSDLKYALDQSAIVATTDVKGLITYVNDKFCQISKYSREELLGQDHRIINSAYHPKEFIRDLWRTIAGGRVWRGEIRNRAKDGSTYWVDTTIVPLLDERDKPYQYIAIRYDITERKAAEERLREQAALVRLGEMAAVVAHEVKNPLAGLRGALQVIGKRLPSGGPDAAIVGEMVARIDALNRMVQDLLLFARPRQPRLAPVQAAALVREAAEFIKIDPALKHTSITVDDGGDPMVSADVDLLKLVFFNVLLNAAQAARNRGGVRVRIHDPEDGMCRITIADDGPGIAPEIRDRIFQPFFTTRHRGTGLGLPIAKRAVELHGGELSIESPKGGGTTVTVRLPTVP